MPRVRIALKALRELGPRQVGLYARYQARLRLGRLRFSPPDVPPGELRLPLLPLPHKAAVEAVMGSDRKTALLAEAEEILSGQVRLFGQLKPQPLRLAPPGPRVHWTEYELGRQAWGLEDVKFIWEPARFGWSFTLARAYRLDGDERWPQAFWQLWETFQAANPAYQGQNWASAQEAALRLMALVFAVGVFQHSPHSTAERMQGLAQRIAEHAARILPSLDYARAQHNNHLLSEAAGLYTAALALPHHPDSPQWRKLGKGWFEHGVCTQFTPEGVYAQHSANYQRLALQLGVWMNALARAEGEALAPDALERLEAGTRWLLALLDPISGQTPNLGPNDGAYILALTNQPFRDYRPALQSAGRAFTGAPVLPAGPWDDLSLWLSQNTADNPADTPVSRSPAPTPLVLRGPHSWAYLRVEKFTSRPGHADQLHLDLWWRGLNITQDAGTYLYKAPHPWDNALARTAVHNTLTVQDHDQMTRAGRFLFLDWAQGGVLAYDTGLQERAHASAFHDGYSKLGLRHERTVLRRGDSWTVEDHLKVLQDSPAVAPVYASLHWLLPDGEFRFKETHTGFVMSWLSPFGWVSLLLHPPQGMQPAFQIVRAGELLYRSPSGQPHRAAVSPTAGWTSPTYSEKQPALSVQMSFMVTKSLQITSRWRFPQA